MDRNLRAITLGLTVLVALGAAIWFGSWQHARGPVNQDAEQLETIDGFTTYSVPAAGFKIALPESWTTFRSQEVFGDKGAEAELEQFEGENPEFAGLTGALTDPRSPMKLVAIDPVTSADFGTSMNVIAERIPEGSSFESFARTTEEGLRSVAMVGGLESERVRLRVGPAQRFTYVARFVMAGHRQLVATLQYALVANGRAYVLSFATVPELADEYRDDFERSAESFSAAG